MLSKFTSILTPPFAGLTWPEFTPEGLRTALILIAFAVLFALEARFGYRKTPAKVTRQSYGANTTTFVLNDTLMSLLSVSSLLLVAERYGDMGILAQISNPFWQVVLSLILLDLVLYVWHRANHAFDGLWMFHKVHHSDLSMNVSTAFRLHFGELLLTTLVKAVFIVLTGVDAAILLLNETLITLNVMLHHSNLAFRWERWLARLLVVPYLHRVHHSVRRDEHDNNYGALFSLWDRMFGTLAEREPAEIGLRHVAAQNFLELVKFGLTPEPAPSIQSVQAMIAEAAYYKAEKRGFAPGCDFLDWLEAEKEIKARMTIGDGTGQGATRRGFSMFG
jgi:sterol desaturase/sphingolipid hydroxylase (fatty acid hydroxylase superfamily)